MKSRLIKTIDKWKPVTEFLTGTLGVLLSLVALIISIFALWATNSSPDLSAHPGRHFGLAILRGNHLQEWGLPEKNYSEEERWLVMDLAVVIANAGGKRGVIDHMRLDIERLSTREILQLDWKAYFADPTNQGVESRPELVTPLVVEGSASQKRLIRFSAQDEEALLPNFFETGEDYEVRLYIHRAGSGKPVTEMEMAYSIEWLVDEHNHFNILQRDYLPDLAPASGTTALLTLF